MKNLTKLVIPVILFAPMHMIPTRPILSEAPKTMEISSDDSEPPSNTEAAYFVYDPPTLKNITYTVPTPLPTPIPTPVSTPRQQVISQGVEQWRSEVSKYDWPVEMALAIMRCESGGNPVAVHYDSDGSVDRGLFQINSVHGANSTFDPISNIAYAYSLYKSQGWNPWSTFKNGCYRQYLSS